MNTLLSCHINIHCHAAYQHTYTVSCTDCIFMSVYGPLLPRTHTHTPTYTQSSAHIQNQIHKLCASADSFCVSKQSGPPAVTNANKQHTQCDLLKVRQKGAARRQMGVFLQKSNDGKGAECLSFVKGNRKMTVFGRLRLGSLSFSVCSRFSCRYVIIYDLSEGSQCIHTIHHFSGWHLTALTPRGDKRNKQQKISYSASTNASTSLHWENTVWFFCLSWVNSLFSCEQPSVPESPKQTSVRFLPSELLWQGE